MDRKDKVFEPALSLSYAKGFDIDHYLKVTESIIAMMSKVSGLSEKAVVREFILGLKDMAGVCPPKFMRELVKALRKRWPELVLHYHRHVTDGLFLPACAAAAEAGCQIVDAGLGASVSGNGTGP